MSGEKLNKNLRRYLKHIDAIRDTLPMTLLLLKPYSKKASDDLVEFIKNNVKEIENDNGEKRLLVKVEHSRILDTLENNASISSLAFKIIPESLFVSLISQYDAYLNQLLRLLFEIQPELLNSSERNLKFSQLIDFKTLDDVKDYIIEMEIDTVMRKSHSEQFEYLEKKLSIKLRENLPIFKTFIEITERRNLLVHCDGIISNQYLKNCHEYKCKIDKMIVGDKLGISAEYFTESYKALYEIAVKLTHTIWRKLLSKDLKEADRELNNICFDLLCNKSFELADILLGFGYNQKAHFNESLKNVFTINKALSKYLQGDKVESKKILDEKDWSACSDDFKLVYEVLNENYSSVYQIMEKIGKNGDIIDKTAYREWPIFIKIRQEEKFQKIYKKIFKEEYTVLETPNRPVQNLLESEFKKSKNLRKKKKSK